MTEQDYSIIEQALQEAEKDTTPFVVQAEGENIAVAGDVNKTQLNKHDFVMKFRVPKTQEDGSVKYQVITKEYKDKYPTPRQDTMIIRMIMRLFPYFKKIEDTGDVTELSPDEKRAIFETLDEEIYDVMYEVVGAFLGVDKQIREYMMPGSVLNAVAHIIQQYPEVANEADTFFE